MTEFEMAYLMNDMQLAMGTAVQYNFVITSAFVVAAYLLAHRLTRVMVVVVVTIYTLAVAGNVLVLYRIMQNMAGLALQIKAYAQAGKGLAWHSMAQVPLWSLDSLRYVGVALLLTASAASIYFFFHSRRANRIADVPSADTQAKNELPPAA